ncbi:MAG: response regulator [Butyrivibrio sp.]|nr:response regulator [Butyrivibrio sp.]
MNLKIMITGKNRKIAANVYEHLKSDTSHVPFRCTPVKSALLEMAEQELPQVIIICTGYENAESASVYNPLKDYEQNSSVHFIVVANDDDKHVFLNETKLSRIHFLTRPISINALYWKLEEFEDYFQGKPEPVRKLTERRAPNRPPRKHILVVDDDPEQLSLIKSQLREFYDVTLISNGRSALKALEKHRVNLILLDYLMPEMDGPAVLTRLREVPEYRDIPVVFLTGVSEKSVVKKTILELKPQGYILKPPKKAELVAKIIDIVG